MGAESGSQEVLNLINKDASVDDTVNLVKQAMEYSIVPVLSLMVGLPGVKDDINATIKLIRDSKLYYPRTRVFMFFIPPTRERSCMKRL